MLWIILRGGQLGYAPSGGWSCYCDVKRSIICLWYRQWRRNCHYQLVHKVHPYLLVYAVTFALTADGQFSIIVCKRSTNATNNFVGKECFITSYLALKYTTTCYAYDRNPETNGQRHPHSGGCWPGNSPGFKCLLVLLDGLEELREVALPEPSAPALLIRFPVIVLEHAPHSLYDLYEYGRPAK